MSQLASLRIDTAEGGVRLGVKAVPGASRSAIAGVLGDELKVAVAAAPEGGKANEAIVATLAEALGVRRAAITIESGHTRPRKRVLLRGMAAAEVREKLSRALKG